MIIVGERKTLATEGASSKKTLGINLSGRWNHNETHLWRARISTIRHQRGRLYKSIMIDGANLSGKKDREG